MSENRTKRVVYSQVKRLAVWLLAALLVAVTISLVFLTTPYEGPSASVDRLDDDPAVSLESVDGGYVIEPARADADGGLVFYPGARVAPSAYLDVVAPLAREANLTVVVPRVDLNLAIVDYGVARTLFADDAASDAMARRPDIDRWYVGGHSLGGVVACRYAANNRERVDGVVLYASYCDRDVSGSGLAALSVVGAGDTVLDRDRYDRALSNLPGDARIAELEGLNHTHFGSYGGQRGDSATGTSYETAHRRINELAVPWFHDETAASEPSEHLIE